MRSFLTYICATIEEMNLNGQQLQNLDLLAILFMYIT